MTHFTLRTICSRLALRYVLCVPLFLGVLVNSSTENMGNTDSKVLSAPVAKFSAKFCNELAKGKSVVSSPLSAEFVLALLALGATDDVHDELLIALGVADDDSIRSTFSAVSSKLESIKGVTLNVANKVYIKDGPYELESKLKQDAIEVFNADFEKLNFSDGGAAADIINKWVESKTNNRIKDLLSSDSINEDSRLVLVNALYFKGTWAKQFDPRKTSPRPFHIEEGKTIDVQMMYKEDNYRYGDSQELDSQLLQLDYVGGETSMVIVLPNQINGLNGVLQKLASGYDLMNDVERMYRTKIQVSIPKFKIETEIDLTELLPKLGIKGIFDQSNTGLSKILNTGEQLYVSTAVQKAFIEVNEEGAEAAAATGAVSRRCCKVFPKKFRAERPFLAAIVSGDILLFASTYRSDSQSDSGSDQQLSKANIDEAFHTQNKRVKL